MTVERVWEWAKIGFMVVLLGGTILKAAVWMVREAVDEWKNTSHKGAKGE